MNRANVVMLHCCELPALTLGHHRVACDLEKLPDASGRDVTLFHGSKHTLLPCEMTQLVYIIPDS